jgi:hypothetical protein
MCRSQRDACCLRGPDVTSPLDREDRAISAPPSDPVEVLIWFGILMLRAGNTAVRTREWMEVMARKMGFDALSVSLSLDSIALRVRRSGEWISAMREIGPPGGGLANWCSLQEPQSPCLRHAISP